MFLPQSMKNCKKSKLKDFTGPLTLFAICVYESECLMNRRTYSLLNFIFLQCSKVEICELQDTKSLELDNIDNLDFALDLKRNKHAELCLLNMFYFTFLGGSIVEI